MSMTTTMRGLISAAGIMALALLCCSSASAQTSEKMFYRYTDKAGVSVINSSIPPEYAQNGYELVTRYGRLVKKVLPAATGEQLEQRRSEEELKIWDAELLRRYSSADEIKAAKKRKLENVNGNIQILSGNLSTIETSISIQLSIAANQERAGKKVSTQVLKQLKELKARRQDTQEYIQLRKKEMTKTAKKFDQDLARFRKITYDRH